MNENYEVSFLRKSGPIKIHIASPPTEINFVEDAKELLYQTIPDTKIHITTTNNMQQFLEENYERVMYNLVSVFFEFTDQILKRHLLGHAVPNFR